MTDADVELRVGQIERRAQSPLQFRIVAFGCHTEHRVCAVGLKFQALPERQRSGAQAPVPRRLITAPGFDPVARAFYLVGDDEGTSGGGFDAAQFVVNVVEQGDRIRCSRRRLSPVSDFEYLDDLGHESWSARELNRRAGKEVAVDA